VGEKAKGDIGGLRRGVKKKICFVEPWTPEVKKTVGKQEKKRSGNRHPVSPALT